MQKFTASAAAFLWDSRLRLRMLLAIQKMKELELGKVRGAARHLIWSGVGVDLGHANFCCFSYSNDEDYVRPQCTTPAAAATAAAPATTPAPTY